MTESWFDRLEDDVRHAASHFHHHSPNIAGNQPQQPQEPAMALADTSTSLKDTSANLRTTLENGASALREALDNHLTQLDTAIGDVAAVASIADHPLVVAAAGALHVPAPVLEGFVNGLTALAKAFPKPEEAPVAEVPAEPVQEAA